MFCPVQHDEICPVSCWALYTSKTQHPNEGHISKSIKQVYPACGISERTRSESHHLMAAMSARSSQFSRLPTESAFSHYITEGTFYLNSQIGESRMSHSSCSRRNTALRTCQGAGLVKVAVVQLGRMAIWSWTLRTSFANTLTIHDEFATLTGLKAHDSAWTLNSRSLHKTHHQAGFGSFWAGIKADDDLAVEDGRALASPDLGPSET